MQDRAERKPDHGGGNRSAENDDDGVLADEQVQIAAQEHHRCDYDRAKHEPDAGHDVHGRLQRIRQLPAVLNGSATRPEPHNATLRKRH